MSGDAYMFVYDGSRTGEAAMLPGWELRTDADGNYAARGHGALQGVIVPVRSHELGALDDREAQDGFARAIAMIDIAGKRTWAFFYTRTSDWRDRRVLRMAV